MYKYNISYVHVKAIFETTCRIVVRCTLKIKYVGPNMHFHTQRAYRCATKPFGHIGRSTRLSTPAAKFCRTVVRQFSCEKFFPKNGFLLIVSKLIIGVEFLDRISMSAN